MSLCLWCRGEAILPFAIISLERGIREEEADEAVDQKTAIVGREQVRMQEEASHTLLSLLDEPSNPNPVFPAGPPLSHLASHSTA